MGGAPLLALNLVAWPREGLPFELLARVIDGGADVVRDAGALVAGGHSIDDPEPKFGLAVVGTVEPDRVWRNGGGRPGDVLVLTKPIGLGVISTAVKRDGASPELLATAVDVMTTLNAAHGTRAGSSAPRVHGVTDVTGFGLLGHLGELDPRLGRRRPRRARRGARHRRRARARARRLRRRRHPAQPRLRLVVRRLGRDPDRRSAAPRRRADVRRAAARGRSRRRRRPRRRARGRTAPWPPHESDNSPRTRPEPSRSSDPPPPSVRGDHAPSPVPQRSGQYRRPSGRSPIGEVRACGSQRRRQPAASCPDPSSSWSQRSLR